MGVSDVVYDDAKESDGDTNSTVAPYHVNTGTLLPAAYVYSFRLTSSAPNTSAEPSVTCVYVRGVCVRESLHAEWSCCWYLGVTLMVAEAPAATSSRSSSSAASFHVCLTLVEEEEVGADDDAAGVVVAGVDVDVDAAAAPVAGAETAAVVALVDVDAMLNASCTNSCTCRCVRTRRDRFLMVLTTVVWAHDISIFTTILECFVVEVPW